MYADLVKTPKYRRWSKGAIDCYNRNCVCNGCETFDLIGKQCRMKYAVIFLVKNIGIPEETTKIEIINDTESEETTMFDKDLNLEYPNYMEKIIDSLKKGYETYSDLESATGQNRKAISVYIDGFHKLLLSKDLIKNSDKSKRLQVVDFIQSRLCETDYKQTPVGAAETEQEQKPEQTTPDEPLQTKSQFISRIADLSEQCNTLISENDKLKHKITVLEKQLQAEHYEEVDFEQIKTRIKMKMQELDVKLHAIEIAEKTIQDLKESEIR